MITKNNILDFNNDLKISIEELEREIAECEAKTKELRQKCEILGRTHEAIMSVVGKDERVGLEVSITKPGQYPDSMK